MEPEMKYESVLAEFCDRMQTEANKIVESAKQQNQDGMYRVLLSDYAPALGVFPLDMPLLYEMLHVAGRSLIWSKISTKKSSYRSSPNMFRWQKVRGNASVRKMRILCAPSIRSGLRMRAANRRLCKL